jgi:general secretion pathway protein D
VSLSAFHRVTALMGLAAIVAALAGCARPDHFQQPTSLLTTDGLVGTEQPSNGRIFTPAALSPRISYGTVRRGAGGGPAASGPGLYSLDFADTDVREVVAQILGTMLGLNYSIDPAVKGTVTLHTAQPLTAAQLLPTLETILGSVGAVLVRTDGLYRVVSAATAGSAGSLVLPLKFVSADDLAKVLQPLAGTNAKIVAETSLNAVLLSGDPGQVQSLAELVRTFDTDALAGQSYAVLPVTAGNAKDFADAMTEAFHGKGGAGLSGLVRVVPLTRLNAVLVVSSQPTYIDAARRVFDLIERQRRTTVRVWHAFYLQNSNANDIAYTLQMAFTPNNVTALPQSAQQGNGAQRGAGGFAGQGGISTGGIGAGASAGGVGAGGIGGGAGGIGAGGGLGAGGIGALGGANPLAPSGAGGGAAGGPQAAQARPQIASNPLLGGLDQGTSEENADAMRILPNPQNNAILVYGTEQEDETVAAMLRKIDITPLQVRIDATIAEVTLNDNLQYGTQFFFRSGGINGILNNATQTVTSAANAVLGMNFPGFVLAGNGAGGAPLAISALQAVTTVNVLSSPQLTVVDNQPARLQVGALVPYLTASSQSTITANAPVINSIAYQPTGVIMEVTPRVNSGGQVTLDVSQEVSQVDNTPNTTGINSPTFTERSITSRIVIQDGQTVGLAGLIQDNTSRGNQGIPWFKDIPLLGALAGTQTNTRQRTELLVLLTPHVIRGGGDARALTEDLRSALPAAAQVAEEPRSVRLSGSSDPNRKIREKVRRAIDHVTHPNEP